MASAHRRRQTLRQGEWKLDWSNVDKNPQGIPELYNLKSDPGETNDLAARYPDRVKQMKQMMLAEHVPSEEFPFAYEKK